MLITFLGGTIFVEISSLIESTFGLGNAVCIIIWGENLFTASAKFFILDGYKSQFFGGSNLFFGEATNGLSLLNFSLAKIFSTEI